MVILLEFRAGSLVQKRALRTNGKLADFEEWLSLLVFDGSTRRLDHNLWPSAFQQPLRR